MFLINHKNKLQIKSVKPKADFRNENRDNSWRVTASKPDQKSINLSY